MSSPEVPVLVLDGSLKVPDVRMPASYWTSTQIQQAIDAAVPNLDATALGDRVTALETEIQRTPMLWFPVSGVFPPRPATTRRVWFMSSTVVATLDGSLTGGGGMIPNYDAQIAAMP